MAVIGLDIKMKRSLHTSLENNYDGVSRVTRRLPGFWSKEKHILLCQMIGTVNLTL